MKISDTKIKLFQQEILTWYKIHKRSLPWRDVPVGTSLQERAYMTLVSEVMSQQTQINRVVVKFDAWMKRFTTVEDVARATVADVLAYWSGLGYNRRALNLKKTSEIIVGQCKGKFPQTEEELVRLPGIGAYTARAVLCFAFDQQLAVVDTNVRKIIVTQFGIDGKGKQLQEIADQLLPKGKSSEWNQALMDYAATMLKKEKIPIPKQSKFVGSHRYYRGKVLKILLKKKKIFQDDLGLLIKENYVQTDKPWLQKLLMELEEEGFIRQVNGMIVLS